MVRDRASSQARTPLATPMPPTNSEVSPTRVMNSPVCCTNRATTGAAALGSRIRQPWLGNAARRPEVRLATLTPGGSTARNR